MISQLRRNPPLLLALALVVASGVAVTAFRASRATARGESDPADVVLRDAQHGVQGAAVGPGLARDPREPAARRLAAIVDPGQGRDDHSDSGPDGLAAGSAGPEDGDGPTGRAQPPAGAILFQGTVVTDDEVPLRCEGAVIRVYRESDARGEAEFVGTAPVSSSGRFQLVVPLSARHSTLNQPDEWIHGQLVAPGYDLVTEGADVREAVGGVLTVRMEAFEGGSLLVGRVVDPLGQPVRGAWVRYLEWGRNGEGRQDGECESESDGSFGFSLADGGWVDVVAVHPSHGMGRATGRIERPERRLDVGDVVLEPRAVISGVVLGSGGRPLPFHQVDVEPADEFSDDPGVSVVTAADGTFRCANLERIPYRVVPEYHVGEWEDQIVVTPDAHGVTVRVPHPSATVTVLGPDGRPAWDIGFSCTLLGDDGNASRARWVESRGDDTGVHELLLEAPGRYIVSAQTWFDDVRWSATRIVSIGHEHRTVELHLQRDDGRPVVFEVMDLAGEPIPGWSLSVRDPRSLMRISNATAGHPSVRLVAGRLQARVTPDSPSLVMPFLAPIEVVEADGDEPQVLVVQGGELGGRVSVSLSATDGHSVPAYVTLFRGSGGKQGGAATVQVNGAPTPLRGPIPAGSYELLIERRAKLGVPAAKRRVPFDLRAGETKSLSLTFPSS